MNVSPSLVSTNVSAELITENVLGSLRLYGSGTHSMRLHWPWGPHPAPGPASSSP